MTRIRFVAYALARNSSFQHCLRVRNVEITLQLRDNNGRHGAADDIDQGARLTHEAVNTEHQGEATGETFNSSGRK